MPGRPKIVSMPFSFSASITSWKPSVSATVSVAAPACCWEASAEVVEDAEGADLRASSSIADLLRIERGLGGCAVAATGAPRDPACVASCGLTETAKGEPPTLADSQSEASDSASVEPGTATNAASTASARDAPHWNRPDCGTCLRLLQGAVASATLSAFSHKVCDIPRRVNGPCGGSRSLSIQGQTLLRRGRSETTSMEGGGRLRPS